MKLIRTISMHTNYSYHGAPIETSSVSLYVDAFLTPEQIEIAKRNQEMKLQSMAKQMPHEYWRKVANVQRVHKLKPREGA